MMGFKFGKNSTKKLMTCHKDLILIMQESIERTRIDFGITEGHRSLQRQYQLFIEGKSKIDGKSRKGKHNHSPSMAVDIYIYHPDIETRRILAYDRVSLAYVAGVIDAVAYDLKKKGLVRHTIRWGANWDSDGVIDLDQAFDDYPHFELK